MVLRRGVLIYAQPQRHPHASYGLAMNYPENIKPQEIPVFDFLYGLDQGVPVYKPCLPGPDFLLEGFIAIETTLLEQSIEFNDSKVKIEENYKSIRDYLLSLFSKIDNSYSGYTYFVHKYYTAEIKNLNCFLTSKLGPL